MENNVKSKNGIVIVLIVLVLLLAVAGTLLFTGVIKSPLIKEKECEKTTVEEKKEEKETRYYQYKSEPQMEADGAAKGNPKYYEVELNKDGTAKIDYLYVLNKLPKEGIYVEDDNYIIVTLNTKSEQCYEGNYNPTIADTCAETIVFVKDNGVLKVQNGSLYHFKIENAASSMEFEKVNKSDLKTELKN